MKNLNAVSRTAAIAAVAVTLAMGGCSSNNSTKIESGPYGTMPEGSNMTTGGDIAPDYGGAIGATGPK